jgi:hypothetical protein
VSFILQTAAAAALWCLRRLPPFGEMQLQQGAAFNAVNARECNLQQATCMARCVAQLLQEQQNHLLCIVHAISVALAHVAASLQNNCFTVYHGLL